MTDRYTTITLLVAAVAALSLVAPVAVAAPGAGNATSGNATAPPGSNTTQPDAPRLASNPTDYTVTELLRRGTRHPSAPNSMRFLGDYGSVTVRYTPAGPLASGWNYLNPGKTVVHRNQVTLRSVRMAPSDMIDPRVTVHVVAWQRSQTTVVRGNETVTVPAAANVTHTSYTVTLDRGYDNATIQLPPNYDRQQKITMWIDEYPGTRWVFDHRSVPAAQGVPVDDRGDLWLWAAQNILLVAVPGILVSTVGARKMIEQTAAGPMKGAVWWGVVGVVALFGIALFGWFQTAIVLAHVPQLIGVAIAAVTFVAMLEVAGRPHDWAMFERHELEDAKNPLGDDIQDAIYEELAEHRVVRGDDDSLRLVKPGIRPFLARFFADPAKIPDEHLKTQVDVRESKWRKKFLAHPLADEPVYWHPARWVRTNPFVTNETVREVNGEEVELKLWERARWTRIAIGVGALALGVGFGQQVGLGALGAIVGLSPAVAMAYEARDGHADFQPAPVHMRRSEASLTQHRDEFSAAETYREADRQRWQAEASNVEEIRRQAADRDATLSQELNRALAGMDIVDTSPSDENGTGDATSGDIDNGEQLASLFDSIEHTEDGTDEQ